jgi:hypothetical protein
MPGEGYKTTAQRAIANRGRTVRSTTIKRSSPLASKRNTTRKSVKIPRVTVTPQTHTKFLSSIFVENNSGETAHLYQNRRNGVNFRNILNDNPRLSAPTRKVLATLRQTRNSGYGIDPKILKEVKEGVLDELVH